MALQRPSDDFKLKQDVNPSVNRRTEATSADFIEAASLLNEYADEIEALKQTDSQNPYYGKYTSLALLQSTHNQNILANAWAIIDSGVGVTPQIATWESSTSQWEVGTAPSEIHLFYNSVSNFPATGIAQRDYVALDTMYVYVYRNNQYLQKSPFSASTSDLFTKVVKGIEETYAEVPLPPFGGVYIFKDSSGNITKIKFDSPYSSFLTKFANEASSNTFKFKIANKSKGNTLMATISSFTFVDPFYEVSVASGITESELSVNDILDFSLPDIDNEASGGSSLYLGQFTSLANLETAHPAASATSGQWAVIDDTGEDARNAILDVTEYAWVLGGAATGLPDGGTINDELIKQSGTNGDAEWYRKAYYNVKLYGVKGDGERGSLGNISSGTSTFTDSFATFTSEDVGKVICIEGAGVSGAYLTTTIASFTNANQIELTDNASTTVSNTIYRYGTDDTAAIQSLIDSFDTDVSFSLFFPLGVYILNGALQKGINDAQGFPVDYNSQIYFPNMQNLQRRRTIEIIGEVPPNMSQGAGIGNFTTPITGVILHSTLTSTSGTLPSVFAQGVTTDPVRVAQPDYRPYDYNHIVVKNVSTQWTPNSNNAALIGGFNGGVGKTAKFENVTHFPYNLNLVNSSEPPLKVIGFNAANINCEHINVYDTCLAGGMTVGLSLGEHTVVRGCDMIACLSGYEATQNYQYCEITRSLSKWCKYDLTFDGNTSSTSNSFIEARINTEWASSGKWYDYEATINDPTNNIRGFYLLNAVQEFVGNETLKLITRIGAHNLEILPLSGGISFPTNQTYGFNNRLASFDVFDLFNDTEIDSYKWDETLKGVGVTISETASNRLEFTLAHTQPSANPIEGNEIQRALISKNYAYKGNVTMNFDLEYQNATRDSGLVHAMLWDVGTTQDTSNFNVARIFPDSVAGRVAIQIWEGGSSQYVLTGITPSTNRFKIEYSFNTNEIKFYNWNGASWTQLGTTQTYNIHNVSNTLKACFSVNDNDGATGIDFAYLNDIYLSEKHYTTELPF